jgi:hypothetical protein
MREFRTENNDINTNLIYELKQDEQADMVAIEMIQQNSNIPGLLKMIYTQNNSQRVLKYNITSKITLQQLLERNVTKKTIISVLINTIRTLISADEYLLEQDCFVLDMEKVFVDISSYEVGMIYLPIKIEKKNVDYSVFFKNLILISKYDESENCEYVAQIISYLNSASFSLVGFYDYLHQVGGLQKEPLNEVTYQQQPQLNNMQVQPQMNYQMNQQINRQVTPQMNLQTNQQMNQKMNQSVPNVQAENDGVKTIVDSFATVDAINNKKSGMLRKNQNQMQMSGQAPNVGRNQMAMPGQAPNVGRNQMAMPGQAPNIGRNQMAMPGQAPNVGRNQMAMPGQAPNVGRNQMAMPGQAPNIGRNQMAMPGQAPNVGRNQMAMPGQAPNVGRNQMQMPGQAPMMGNPLPVQNKKEKKAANKKDKKKGKLFGGNSETNNVMSVPNANMQNMNYNQSVQNNMSNNMSSVGMNNMSNRSIPNNFASGNSAFNNMPQSNMGMNNMSQNNIPGFGETTVLGVSNSGETTVLTPEMNPNNQGNVRQAYLVREKNGERVPITKEKFIIGKEKSFVDYFIADNTAISRSHAYIVNRNNEYYIVDTNSKNHTYVDGKLITPNTEINITNDCKIKLADEDFIFNIM